VALLAPISAPSSERTAIMDPTQEAIGLVVRLNDPRYMSDASAISARIQAIQLSQDAWEVADQMLRHEDQHVQFYGALTFQIKLNREGRGLSAHDMRTLRRRLITGLFEGSTGTMSKLVIDKLCLALGICFKTGEDPWSCAIQDLVMHAAEGHMTESGDATARSLDNAIHQLTIGQRNVILRFAQLLAEEMSSVEGSSPQM